MYVLYIPKFAKAIPRLLSIILTTTLLVGAKADEKLLVVVRGEIGISILSFLISEMKN